MHLLEMAKTAWNAIIKSNDVESLEKNLGLYFASSREVLEIFGREGDDGGPWAEIDTLQNLLSTAQTE